MLLCVMVVAVQQDILWSTFSLTSVLARALRLASTAGCVSSPRATDMGIKRLSIDAVV